MPGGRARHGRTSTARSPATSRTRWAWVTETEAALRAIFEAYDGGGVPGLLQGSDVPLATSVVALASDLEIFGRLYGLDEALALARGRADQRLPRRPRRRQPHRGPPRMDRRCSTPPPRRGPTPPRQPASMRRRVGLELVGDVIDLKLPWMTGYSRRVAAAGARLAACAHMGLDEPARQRTYKAGLIHGIGRAAGAQRHLERARAAARLVAGAPAPRAVLDLPRRRADRRPRGSRRKSHPSPSSGATAPATFRGRSGTAMPLEGQAVAAAEQWVSHRTRRPWRAALTEAQSCARLHARKTPGRAASIQEVVAALLASALAQAPRRSRRCRWCRRRPAVPDDSLAVSSASWRCCAASAGATTPSRSLARWASAPRTVRTHVERLFPQARAVRPGPPRR
jgi:hypothetical protein